MRDPGGNITTSVRQALARRSILDRAMLALHFAAGMPVDEIARSLSMPASTVVHRIAQALQSVRCECAPDSNVPIAAEQIAGAISSGLAAPAGLRRRVGLTISARAERRWFQ